MGKMSEDIKMKRNLAKLAKLMGPAAPVSPEKITREMAREARATKPSPIYEAEAVLLMLEQPARFMVKPCKREECKEPFGTNYRSVAYCSDNCRIKELKTMGILWNPSKRPEERWGGEAPLLIPPAALKMLIHLAQTQVLTPPESQPELSAQAEEAISYSRDKFFESSEPQGEDLKHIDPQNVLEVEPDATAHYKLPQSKVPFDFPEEEFVFDF